MRIWVDADACPSVIKDILYRAANRERVQLTLVANRRLRPPQSQYVTAIVVPAGFDVADSRIITELQPGDLVITADIPLAAEALAKGGHALNPRGELYTKDNIDERLSMRNFTDSLRGTGVVTGGPPSLSQTDRRDFANSLDAFLTRHRQA